MQAARSSLRHQHPSSVIAGLLGDSAYMIGSESSRGPSSRLSVTPTPDRLGASTSGLSKPGTGGVASCRERPRTVRRKEHRLIGEETVREPRHGDFAAELLRRGA